jgi:osmoprotectant transport system substrate-binding protein
MKKILKSFVLLLCLSPMVVTPALACVGKTLEIGTTGSVQQNILANMIAELISERTGTSVKLVQFANSTEAHAALVKADIDMYVEYTGVGQGLILQGAPVADSAELYKQVKDRYNQDMNLIWLQPLGFDAASTLGINMPAEPAPVVRKDTLKKFPALARLINKLGGKIDQQAISQLEQQAAEAEAAKVAHNFLKSQRLI